MIVLQTERLLLRRFTAEDADLLHALDSDPAVMRYINGGKPTPREQIAHETLPALLEEYERTPGYGRWAAFERTSGEFVGWLALRVATPGSDDAELGYRLRQTAWGHGYATEGARALIAKAFADLGTQRIWATTMTVNEASRRVMEKAGLRFVRTFFEEWPDVIEGSEQGDVEYAVTRDAWRTPDKGSARRR